MTWQAKLKHHRLKLHLTQVQLAALLNCSVRTIESWEGGRIEPAGYVQRLIVWRLKGEIRLQEAKAIEAQIDQGGV